jgi:hypothetical protein
VWFPTQEELQSGGVVTRFTSGDEFALSGVGTLPDQESMSKDLQKLRLYRALRSREPEIYEQVVHVATEAFREGKSLDELRAATTPLFEPALMKRLPSASDVAVLRFGRLLAAQLEALQAAPGSLCLDYAMGRDGESANQALKYLPETLVAEERETLADVFESDATGKPVGDARVKQLIGRAVKKMGHRGPEHMEIIAALDEPGTDPIRACRALHALYSSILQLPEKDAAALLRSILAEGW